jgi:CheY-like chemotaxis protein
MIVVADDDPDSRELVCLMLRREGFVVCEAEDGADALRLLSDVAVSPCLLLTDLMMPGMSGPELVDAIRQVPRLAGLPVAVMSAAGHADAVPSAIKFLQKPVSLEGILTVAREYGRRGHVSAYGVRRLAPEWLLCHGPVMPGLDAFLRSLARPPDRAWTQLTSQVRPARLIRFVFDASVRLWTPFVKKSRKTSVRRTSCTSSAFDGSRIGWN